MLHYFGYRTYRVLGSRPEALLGATRLTHSHSLWEELLGKKLQPSETEKIEQTFLDCMYAQSLPSWLPFLPHASFWIPSSEDTLEFLHFIAGSLKASFKRSTPVSDSEVFLFEYTDKLLYHFGGAPGSHAVTGTMSLRAAVNDEKTGKEDSDTDSEDGDDTGTVSELTPKGT